jgi:23S rRNA pseudouridine1911/1915/1917 synthase
MNVLDHLRKQLPHASMNTLRQMIRDRRVAINDTLARTLKDEVPVGATVRIAPIRTTARKSAKNSGTRGGNGLRGSSIQDLENRSAWNDIRQPTNHPTGKSSGGTDQVPFSVVHQDRDLIVIDKPSGLLTSSTPNERRPTALGILRESLQLRNGRVGLVHRLDLDASGLCVFSLHTQSFVALKRQFADKSARRTYRAVVDGHMDGDSGTIDNLLVELIDGTVRPTSDPKRGKRAVTHWTRLAVLGPLTLLELRLETGRKHQLRAQLADLSRPIVGDVLYHQNPNAHFPMPGISQRSPAARPRLLLAAFTLGLIHPRTGKPIEFSIDTPQSFGDWSATNR